MAVSGHTFKSYDFAHIVYYKHTPAKDPKAIVIITHGMAEHARRYDHFAEFLNSHSFIVYAHDQRGHGETAGKTQKIGFISNKNGWEKITLDLKEMVDIAKKENPGLPVFLLGHSMGSLVVRTFLIRFSEEIQGVILSGTAGSAGFLAVLGNILTSIIMIFKKKSSPSPLMDTLVFGSFNKEFEPKRTKFDWLSRDEKVVDDYVADPLCGTIFSLKFFKDLANGVEYVNKSKYIENIRKDISIYSFAGDKDPVGKNGKQVTEVYDMYKKAGIKDIELKLYPEARHETLNEINKEEVYSDIINWINKKLS